MLTRTNLALVILCVSVSYLILGSSLQTAFALPSTTQTKVSTGDVNLGGVLTLRVDYSLSVDLSGPKTGTQGQALNYQIAARGGSVQITVRIAGQTYSKSVSLPLGQSVDIPVATGLAINIFATAQSSLAISGPANANVNTFAWSAEGSQPFKVTISSNAQEGSTIGITAPTSIVLNAGASISLPLIGNKQIASTSLGTFQASPTPSENIQVASQQKPSFQLGFPSLGFGMSPIALSSSFIALLAAVNYFFRKKTPRENLVQGDVAVIGGLIFLLSLMSDWLTAGGSTVPGINVGGLFPDIPIVGTLFDFMLVFGALCILGGFLHAGNYGVGRRLIKAGGNLAILFSVAFITGLSLLPGLQPYWIAWLTVISAIITRISVSIRKT